VVLGNADKKVQSKLQKIGKEVTVLRPSSGTTNGYGKEDGKWTSPTSLGTWYAFKSTSSSSRRPSREFTGGGERDESQPVFILPASASVQDGDRIRQLGTDYQVTSAPVEYTTHYEVKTQKVEG